MCEHSSEVWKDIAGYEGVYQVSDLGRVRSFKYGYEKILNLIVLPKGYRYVILRKDGRGKNSYIHRLVLESFVGPCPPGMECRHFPDNDPANNTLANLSWGTPQENAKDKESHGTTGKGRRSQNCGEKIWWIAKLTEAKVRKMRDEWSRGGYTIAQFARKHGVVWQTAKDIVTGHTWKHLLEERTIVGSEVKSELG